MTYFGISNIDHINDPFINDLNLFPTITEETLSKSIDLRKTYIIPAIENTRINYDPIPILFQHRNNDMLKDIWKNVKNGDIITNRGSKKSLISNTDNVIIEKKWIEADEDEHEKFIYLISPKQLYMDEKKSAEKLIVGSQAPTVVFNNLSNRSHTIYRYIKRYNIELQCYEHYTCEIDGFVKSEIKNEIIYTPVEFKCFQNPSLTHELDVETLWDNVKINTIIQCMLSDINNVICGLRNSFSMKLRYYDIPTLINGLEHNVIQSFERIQTNTVKLMKRHN
uniref:Uncharacterized protein n=1 Tax=Panagrolaimus sp. PS1159 TaxID=55785 RepID=A0AC35F350_9BILA